MKNMRKMMLRAGLAALAMGMAGSAQAAVVAFSSATATYNQTVFGTWDASQMIDGTTSGVNGWAIFDPVSGTSSASALFTLATPLAAGSYNLAFRIDQGYAQGHNLGNFSLGYTTAGSPTLLSAMTSIFPSSASALSGATFTFPNPGEFLVGGINADTDIYTIFASISSGSAITGIFLNAIDNPANGLPFDGPGRQVTNGNFVVSEFTLNAAAVPEPASWALMLAGFGLAGGAMRRRAKVSFV
jgi:PEP-CTERM motif